MKKTKIICTISNKKCSPDFIKQLWHAGMNIVRINTAHLDIDGAQKITDDVRAVSDTIGILIDTKGPEIRLNATYPQEGFNIEKDEIIAILDNNDNPCIKYDIPAVIYAGMTAKTFLTTSCKLLFESISKGDKILLDDGDISLTVTGKVLSKKSGKEVNTNFKIIDAEKYIICKVENGGRILGHKSVNVPGVDIELPSLNQRDIEFINWAIKADIDFIAHSFVRNEKDLIPIRTILDNAGSHIKIISKIENKSGVKNLDNILNYSYGVMVARGDLGIEIPAQKIPFIQKEIVDKCRIRKKPVIIATQMLHSMIEHPRPTRAEVTDVANAIVQSTDAIMLSGETANGKYPVESVKTMATIAKEAESNISISLNINLHKVTSPIHAVLSKSLVEATQSLPIKALFIVTESGRTGRYLSEFRPKVPIYAICRHAYTMRELALSYDVYPTLHDNKDEHSAIYDTVSELIAERKLKTGDLIGLIGNYDCSPAMFFAKVGHHCDNPQLLHLGFRATQT